MAGTRAIPSDLNGATSAAVGDQWRRHERDRQKRAERKCADLVDRAWAWIDSRPALADPGLQLFAAQAITLQRTPPGLTSEQLEQWLLDGWQRRTDR